MWQELTLVHNSSSNSPDLPEGHGLLWKTCLRKLLFLEPGATSLPGETYRGAEAHRFLVEICSGLHSPLFGETEVFGQFRSFRAAQVWHPSWTYLLDAVEEDVRKLRRSHLLDIGSQSYGSLARRHLPEGEPVVLVGGGRLALDLLPWLGERPVTVAVRNPGNVTGFSPVVALEAAALSALPSSHWLIAAPVSNDFLLSLWGSHAPRTVLDFRGEQSFPQTPGNCARYIALHTLYAELESVRELHALKREQAMAFAAELSQRRANAVVHRPYGWEDAFA